MSQVWFVTGSSRGLGRDIVEAALADGHAVVATARTPSQLQSFVDRYGDRVLPLALDVTDADAARRAVDDGVARFGRLDVVINNAGYANLGAFEETPDDDFRRQFETNFFGVVNVARAAVPHLRRQRSGHLIQVSSIGGRITTPGMSAYQSAKWAVGGLSEVLAQELAGLGVRVTAVEPGGMRTDWAGSSMTVHPTGADYQATVGAIGSMLDAFEPQSDPAKVAQAILALARETAPPTRIALGSDALFFAGTTAKALARSDERWRALSVSTDADGMGDFSKSDVARQLSGGA